MSQFKIKIKTDLQSRTIINLLESKGRKIAGGVNLELLKKDYVVYFDEEFIYDSFTIALDVDFAELVYVESYSKFFLVEKENAEKVQDYCSGNILSRLKHGESRIVDNMKITGVFGGWIYSVPEACFVPYKSSINTFYSGNLNDFIYFTGDLA